MKNAVCIIFFFIVLFFPSAATQAQNFPTKEGDSNPGYELPTVESIKEAVGRIKNYYTRETVYKIIDIKTGVEITDFNNPNVNAGNDARQNPFTNWDYTMGVLYSALNLATETFDDTSFINYAIKNYNFIFDHLPYFEMQAQKFKPKSYGYGKMIRSYSLDHCGAIGAALIETFQKHPDDRYRKWIDTIDNYISNIHYRLDDGTLARHRPQPSSLWTDDMYMSVPFLVQMGKLTGNTKYWDDAINQVLGLSKRLFVDEKGLFDHGWNANAEYDPKYYWSRANGWAMMAMTELLEELPENYNGLDQIKKILQKQVQSIAELQSPDGLWHNLLDKNDSYTETSGSAMFVYSIAKGINRGWIHFTYGTVAITGWNALQKSITNDGRVKNACIGSTFTNDITYYYNRPTADGETFGNAPVILAGAEIIKLLNNRDLEIINANNTYSFKLKSDPKPR